MGSLTNGYSQIDMAYQPTLWAKMFHSIPHVNITLHPVSPRFAPTSEEYLESLGILASVPAAWLISTLVILLIYLLTRCCDSGHPRRKRKSRPIRCCLSFFSLVCVASLAVGFWGNQVLHVGVIEFGKATSHIERIVSRCQEMARKYNDDLQMKIEQNLNYLYDGPFQKDISQSPESHYRIVENSDFIFHNISKGLIAMDRIRFAIDEPSTRINFKGIPFWVKTFEKYRWPATIALQCILVSFCFILFLGAILHSRCILILFSVCGLFSIIVLWLSASVYLTSAVAMADFCYQPTPWVIQALHDDVPKDILSYYLMCGSNMQNPFHEAMASSNNAIIDIDMRVRIISETARKFYSPSELSPYLETLEQHTEETIKLTAELARALGCKSIFRSYNTSLVAACDTGLSGLILMLLSAVTAGIIFTILVWCNSHTWIYFKHKERYIKVDDQDPYMPLSTSDRSRMTATPSSICPPGHTTMSGGPYGTTMGAYRRDPPYQESMNGSSVSPYGVHVGVGGGHGHLMMQHFQTSSPHQRQPVLPPSLGADVPQSQHYSRVGRTAVMGTMGRNNQPQTSERTGYHGMDNLPATMTLGRRGHYASLRSGGSRGGPYGVPSTSGLADGHNTGPNVGQYATLNKQCKTLESSDFY